MKVTAVTPTDAASDPAHPDHDRWVKETTLAIEVKHAERVGKTFRDAESENAHWLARSERLAQTQRNPSPVTPRKAKSRDQRMGERGVTVRHASKIKQVKPSPCGRCGTCRNCMRERRVLLIMQRRKDSAPIAALADVLIRAAHRIGRFAGLRRNDYERAVVAACEDACNKSIPLLGQWWTK